jgi:HTH-type transcriptional regulator, competence development regulator
MRQAFGEYIRKRRLERARKEPGFSVRQMARKLGVAACYVSKIELGQVGPPSEETTRRLAALLDEDPDVLLALAGKVSSDLQTVIRKRPRLFADLIRELRDAPDHAVLRIVREVRDGRW